MSYEYPIMEVASPEKYTAEEIAYITQLEERIKYDGVPMAVVDYTGRHDQDSFGNVQVIDATFPPHERFGVRDLGHVRGYDFKIILYYNNAALNKVVKF